MRRAALAALGATILCGSPVALAQEQRSVLAVELPPASLEGLLETPLTGILARAGGVGVLTAPGGADPVDAAGAELAAVGGLRPVEDPSALPGEIRDVQGSLLVLLVVPSSSGDPPMLVMAAGTPDELLGARGDPRGLVSDTTRRPGIVSTVDLVPTIDRHRGEPPAVGTRGAPIRVAGSPPTGLVARFRLVEPLRAPAGVVMLGLLGAALAAGMAVLLARRPPPSAQRAVALFLLAVLALPALLLVAVMLGVPSARQILVVTLLGCAVLALAARRVGGADPAVAVAAVAGAGAAAVVLDGLLGWRGMLMPLLGGNAFEGSRFYGLANGYGGVLAAGAILVAGAMLGRRSGTLLLVAIGLLAGLPNFGANFGTSITLFVAAGVWYALRGRERGAVRVALEGAGVALLGVAAVVVAHRFFSPVATHVTTVIEGAERSGLGGLVSVYLRRLALNVQGTAASPGAWVVPLGLPLLLVVVWRRLRPFRPALDAHPEWRDALVVLAAASIVGYLANDTIGVAGMGFVYLAGALVYPSVAMRWTRS